MNEQQIRYMHIRRLSVALKRVGFQYNTSDFGGITVAYYKVAENQYKCAMARCNLKDKDRYNKHEGRRLAHSRLLEDDDVWTLDLAKGTNIYTEMLELVTNFKELRRSLKPEVR